MNKLLAILVGSSTSVYACTVDHGKLSMLVGVNGWTAAVILADTPKELRRNTINAFRKGQIEFLFNYGVLTKGFDALKVDHFFLLPPTSEILYEQTIGGELLGTLFSRIEPWQIHDFLGNLTVHGRPLAYERFLKSWKIKVIEEAGM